MSKNIYAQAPIIVKELAERIGIAPYLLIHDLMEMGLFAVSNESINPKWRQQFVRNTGCDESEQSRLVDHPHGRQARDKHE